MNSSTVEPRSATVRQVFVTSDTLTLDTDDKDIAHCNSEPVRIKTDEETVLLTFYNAAPSNPLWIQITHRIPGSLSTLHSTDSVEISLCADYPTDMV
jgi:hypothetical protein